MRRDSVPSDLRHPREGIRDRVAVLTFGGEKGKGVHELFAHLAGRGRDPDHVRALADAALLAGRAIRGPRIVEAILEGGERGPEFGRDRLAHLLAAPPEGVSLGLGEFRRLAEPRLMALLDAPRLQDLA